MQAPSPQEQHEAEVRRALAWLDGEFDGLLAGTGPEEATRLLHERVSPEVLKGLPFEAVSHALGRWLNGTDPDRRVCALGLIASLRMTEHIPAIHSMWLESREPGGMGGAWMEQLERVLRELNRRAPGR